MKRLVESRQAVRRTGQCVPESPCAGPARKRYHTPHLKIYGRITELTHFGGSQVVDSGVGLGNPF